MDKLAVKEIALDNGFKLKPQADGKQDLNPYVYGFADDLLKRVRLGQQKRYNDLAVDLQRVANTVNPDYDPSVSELHQATATLNELIKGLTDPQFHKDIPLIGVPKIDSIPHYPIEDFKMNDPINPNHYKTQSGVECIDIAELFPYTIGNAIKYLWRAGKKDSTKQELEKCVWYLERAIENGDTAFLSVDSKALFSARAKFNKVKAGVDIDDRNRLVIQSILNNHLTATLQLLDEWITELNE